ncbi:sulfotransferase family 2 domain-containing protein [Ancylobacter radicis]|uniref:Sulfotransferase family 2 domain-containing protein n=1 Tax=Ancylobacter radicis TaxID=2836179 RepID=A0ABS5R8X7_9HYPH|nr:sulfotransferase family 2 domain-containing protein [Ancylobacter radicis]MBS9478131.1 sulfotransferase family 2 domain-containing protein [Ancylobacter radicis]
MSAYYASALPLVFNHIPKSAGTSLADALRVALAEQGDLGEGSDLCWYDRWCFGSFRDFESFSPAARAQSIDTPDELPAGLRFVAGHMAVSTTRLRYPLGQNITFFREPKARLMSHWLFWRAYEDADVAGWGGWADYVRQARGSLGDFLTTPCLVPVLDNFSLRALLWPHPVIPENGPIDPANDEALLDAAFSVLESLAHVDLIENPHLVSRLETWLRRPVVVERRNETLPVPDERRGRLDEHLSDQAMDALNLWSRLDLRLWSHVAGKVMPDVESQSLADSTFAATLERHARLLAGS